MKSTINCFNVNYLKFARSGVVYAGKRLEVWREAVEKQPGLESFRPQGEQILRMNLEAAEARLARIAEELEGEEGESHDDE